MDMGVDKVELRTDEIFASDSGPEPDSCIELAQYTFIDAKGNVIDKGKSAQLRCSLGLSPPALPCPQLSAALCCAALCRYLAILQQEDGEWKYLYDMFSSNGPLTAAK